MQISLAIEREDQVGTITLPSPKHKEEALKCHNTEWEFDDNFNGITTLYSSDDPEVESVIPFFLGFAKFWTN